MNKFCDKCGAEISVDSKFCSECGSEIPNTENKKENILNSEKSALLNEGKKADKEEGVKLITGQTQSDIPKHTQESTSSFSSNILIAIFVSAIFGLLGGFIGIIINAESGFKYGFLFVFVILLIIMLQNLFSNMNYEKKISKANFKNVWEASGHNFSNSISEVCAITGLSEDVCKRKMTKEIIDDPVLYKFLNKNNYEKDLTVEDIKKITEYDFDEIQKVVDTAIKKHIKEINEAEKITKEMAIKKQQNDDKKAIDEILLKTPLRTIYCIDCNWKLEDATKEVMNRTGLEYKTCKNALKKMINDCGLNDAKERIYKSDQMANTQEPYNIYKDKGFQQSTSSNHTINQKPLSTKKQYKANKKAGIVSCPKCGSTSITTSNKKLSVKRGIGGAAVGAPLAGLTGGLSVAAGAVAGGLSSKKIYNVCMNCGHKWKP